MSRFYLRVRARFAAFRWMQAGVFRATAPIVPPSAAWGLVLNLAGVETRGGDDGVTTLVRSDAPPLRISVGRHGDAREPETAVLYQQLHGYRIDLDEKATELARQTHGAKYWIAPARRELLVGLDAVIAVETADGPLAQRVVDGLAGRLPGARYGLPFAGDNSFLIDRIDWSEAPPKARWYERVTAGEGPREGSCRLTVAIDRSDSSRTTSGLYAPSEVVEGGPPEAAWTWVPKAP